MTPAEPDVVVIRRHLLALDEAVTRLRRHAGRPLSALHTDTDARWAVERGLQLCAQNALDVATHLAASAGHDTADYASAVDTLVTLGVLPVDFAGRFRGIAGFRNVLVHGYLSVDLNRVHALLNSGLDNFAEFARHVEAFLERGAGQRQPPARTPGRCGFSSAEIMRRAFLRTVRVNPAEYRHRFRIA